MLLPATPAFTMSSLDPTRPKLLDPRRAAATPEVRYGRQDGPPDVRQFGGYFEFESPDAALLVSLLPRMIHIRGVPRLSQLVRLVGEEAGTGGDRPLAHSRTPGRRPAYRSPPLRASLGDARSASWAGRSPPRRRPPVHARRSRAILDRRRPRARGRNVPFGLLRAFRAHGRSLGHGVSSGLADGRREGSVADRRDRARRRRPACRLRVAEHVQHSVQAPRRGAARALDAICSCSGTALARLRRCRPERRAGRTTAVRSGAAGSAHRRRAVICMRADA